MHPIKMPLNFCSLGFSDDDNKMLQDAEQAIDKAGMWEWMKGEPGEWGYYMSPAPEMREIRKYIKYNHNGMTFGICMKEMQKLAILGIDGYCSMRTQAIAPPSAPKTGPVRTKEMDAKVIEEYRNRAAFARAPKWSYEYIKAFPDVLRGVVLDAPTQLPGVSDPTARRLRY